MAKTIKHFDAALNEIDPNKPELKIILAVLNAAKVDAQNGDLSALCFLITQGEELEQYIFSKDGPSTGRWNNVSPSLEFAKRIWAKIQSGQIKANWGFDQNEFNAIMKPQLDGFDGLPMLEKLEELDTDF